MFELESKLALANTDLIARGSVLMVGFPSGELARELAARAEKVVVFQQDLRAFRDVESSGVEVHFGPWLAPGEAMMASSGETPAIDAIDTAVVRLPREVERLRMSLAMIRPMLTPEGRVILIGHNKAGIRGAEQHLRACIGEPQVADFRFHCRAYEARATTEPAPFSPGDWESRRAEEGAGRTITVCSYPGVFSHGRVDPATRLLLEILDLPPDARVLDVGSGSGVIGAWAAARAPEVTCVDTDALALRSTANTAAANPGGDRVVVRASDVFSDVPARFTHIVSNPPFHAGTRTTSEIGRRLIEEAPDHLERGGELWLVANRFLDYLIGLRERFAIVDVMAEDNRFRVYRARH